MNATIITLMLTAIQTMSTAAFTPAVMWKEAAADTGIRPSTIAGLITDLNTINAFLTHHEEGAWDAMADGPTAYLITLQEARAAKLNAQLDAVYRELTAMAAAA